MPNVKKPDSQAARLLGSRTESHTDTEITELHDKKNRLLLSVDSVPQVRPQVESRFAASPLHSDGRDNSSSANLPPLSFLL